jgi:hypothetical protein
MDDAPVFLSFTSCLMPALLAGGDESAMNFEGLGVPFRDLYCLPQHSYKLGANFAENVCTQSFGSPIPIKNLPQSPGTL